ncbi:uncharacterized protein LOC129216565 [Uloborus diversus]|uniref:uncharacterized protein LOC129216565 n=1 Tax=Uloborus diversus TaxID=327109 RepID=UPI002409FC5A|nr:uncharacterized protein LOC129216565 [Uloborus diversus]
MASGQVRAYEPGKLDDEGNEENKHVRKRRSVKWAPDYDLYEQWAAEYYSQYESPDNNPEAILKGPETLLDKLVGHNKTEEELESERQAAAEKKEFILRSFQVFTWIFCGLIIYCCIRNLIRKILDKICCDFCRVFSFKKKITKLVNNFVPGVYIHKNGKKEFYFPTEEEMEALKEIQKLLYSVV